MKRILIPTLSILMIAAQSQAVVKFKSPGDLNDKELQKKIASAIEEACPKSKALLVEEIATNRIVEEFDQQNSNIYFTSFFKVNGTDADGYHPRTSVLKVESALYPSNNGDSVYVAPITEGTDSEVCK